MPKQKICPSCQRQTIIQTKDFIVLPNQRCSHCGFRLPDESQRPTLKSNDFGP